MVVSFLDDKKKLNLKKGAHTCKSKIGASVQTQNGHKSQKMRERERESMERRLRAQPAQRNRPAAGTTKWTLKTH